VIESLQKICIKPFNSNGLVLRSLDELFMGSKWYLHSYGEEWTESSQNFTCVQKINESLTGFGKTWGLVINGRIYIFGWTIPIH